MTTNTTTSVTLPIERDVLVFFTLLAQQQGVSIEQMMAMALHEQAILFGRSANLSIEQLNLLMGTLCVAPPTMVN